MSMTARAPFEALLRGWPEDGDAGRHRRAPDGTVPPRGAGGAPPAGTAPVRRHTLSLEAGEPRPHAVHVTVHEPAAGIAGAAYSLVLVHGTAGHGACYDDFAALVAGRSGLPVYAPDLEGHGRSGGERGRFRIEGFFAGVRAAALLARRRLAGRPVLLLGSSQGGEVAFHALDAVAEADGAVCMNLLLAAELPFSMGLSLLRSPLATALAAAVGDRARVPLDLVIDFEAAYRDDPAALPQKRADPLYVWSYGLASYRSVLGYRPRIPASQNRKPVLVICGEEDPIVGAEHCRRAYERLGGPKALHVVPGAGHQLMLCRPDELAAVTDAWARHALVARSEAPFEPPLPAGERAYRAFLEREREAPPDYALGPVDRVLARLANGSVRRGVEFFTRERETEKGRFVSEVVAGIDEAAWEELGRRLPGPIAGRARRMAVLGCGDGLAIERLRAKVPALRAWDIVGVDVDPGAVAAARRRFGDEGTVTFVCGDARDPATLEAAAFDVVHAHGILDHCTRHREVVRAARRALVPGGAIFVITPDRNLATWLGFVAVGPRAVFRLGERADVHDYTRFPKPAELCALLAEEGLLLEPDPDAPGRAFHRGVVYDAGPLGLAWGVARRDRSRMRLSVRGPSWWLGGGYLGEYLVVAWKRGG